MLETKFLKDIDDNILILVTDLAVFVTKILYAFIYGSGLNVHHCQQQQNFVTKLRVTNINVLTTSKLAIVMLVTTFYDVGD